MLRLMKKDFYIQKKSGYLAPLLLLSIIILQVKQVNGTGPINSLINSLCIAYMAFFMVMASNFNTVEGDRMNNRLLLSLPIKRRSVIHAKYAMISVWWLYSILLSSIFLIIFNNIFHRSFNQILNPTVVLLSLCFAYLLASIFYPIYYQFGYRVSSLVGIILFVLMINVFGRTIMGNSGIATLISEHPVLSVAILSFVVTILSYLLSERIFVKRDF